MAFFGYKDMDKLSDVDLAIYRYIVSHDEKVPYMRVRELAAGACVSNSSVMRFIRKIGYDSFPEFKVSLKSELKTGEQPSDELPLVTMEAFSDDLLRLIKIVGGILLEADNIFLVGMGASGAIAEYASRQLSALCFNSSAVKDPYYPLSSQLKNTTNNVIITLYVSGKTPELIEMLNNFVNDPDTTLVTITGNLESPLARMGRYALTYNIEESRIHQYYDMTSQVPCVYIIEAILRQLRQQVALNN
ncbi:MurR/RpiR family transcriptional regulator [Latilactobacillus sakei]|uniref:MurR/RpiR family transcriptional regulator n=1 Tax=Latilactobacillus sakei TaxID=1599 RepID=UPI000500F6B2|nr:MurR/RpiR family transcriptional regulator [Latilactobacillus sakei]AST84567.1 MurR/RpiR family transcriptional regulator [Latilactobacillus sakei]AWZ42515.1 MurR/RpiR family transcriptional regulator [Latilactobacillus sakei]AWZ46308.1 MurR/RpiR family transcriptional regulator [Latilactobacillus sakei]KGB15470.1 RpiR family transcriptional regulator [Latilactobacillus sakei]QGL60652.1 SIS domain-containing protein [Latilactobacillus sakei]